MAADRLKGITVEIGGDTTNLSRSLKEVNSESTAIGRELSDVNRLLRFNPGNTELLAQQQTLLNRQIEVTNTRLGQLRSVEGQVRAQFSRGEIDAGQMRAFEREIINTEGRLQHFETQARTSSRNVGAAFGELGKGVKSAILTAVAGEGLHEVVSQAIETAHLETQIKVGFNVPPESVGKVKDLIGNIQAFGVEGETAVEGVRRQLAMNSDKTDEYNTKVLEGAAAISSAYSGIDYTELIQETNEMSGSLQMSQEDAMGMVNSLLKMGFPPDQLDIITEYGAQLQRAGYTASDIQGIFAAGIDTKSWNIDKLNDGIKEGRIRLAQFGTGIDKTTLGLIKGTQISADQLKGWGSAIAQGGDAGKVAMGEVATALSNIQDPVKRNAIGVQLFGTMWEDTGKKVTDTILNYKQHAGDAKQNQDDLNKSIAAMKADPQYQLNKALKDMNSALTPLLTSIATFVGHIATWVSKNPELVATITTIVVVLGILIGVVAGVAAVIGVLDAAAIALDTTMLPLIIGIMGVVAALILIGIIVYEVIAHWKELMAWASNLGKEIKKAFDDWVKGVKQRLDQSGQDIKDMWNGAMKFFKGIDLGKIGKDIIQGLINGIGSMASAVWDKAKSIGESIGKALKKAVNSSSPSKMTMEIGADVGKGLEIGLDNSVGKIDAASKRMAQAALPEIPTNNIQNQTVGGKSLTVNINSPKAMDVREANREFNRTFNRMALQW